MKKFFSIRMWILIIALFFAVLAINPSPLAEGVQVKQLAEDSPAREAGLKPGETIIEINRQEIETLTDFKKETDKLQIEPREIIVTTSEETVSYSITSSIGFKVDDSLTIIDVDLQVPLTKNAVLKEIENTEVESPEMLQQIEREILPKSKVIITTKGNEYAFLTAGELGIIAEKARKSNINKGLDLEGGTRVLIEPKGEEEVTQKQLQNLILVLKNRLNVYGLSDVIIKPATDLDGKKFVVVEIAGATRQEVRELIGEQGVFEAKIGDDVVFEGGKKDVPFVCKDDGSCAGIIPPCSQIAENYHTCTFQFSITLSQNAAKKHAEITGKIPLNNSQPEYLEKQLELFLDEKLVDSLFIGASLKGRETTQIAISGPGYGATEEIAFEDAVKNMEKLQTILITGSLPIKIEIVKLDTVSPALGKEFIDNAILVGALAILAVAVVVFIRYRKIKIIIPMIITSLAEIVIILGVASLIKWNLDLAAIAGIIAAVGTGVDDQIIITDEVLKKRERLLNWKEKIKRAFFIVMAAYGTTVAAMLPLWNAGAGLLRGFALTTIIGVSIGVFITRPAFASMIEKFLE